MRNPTQEKGAERSVGARAVSIFLLLVLAFPISGCSLLPWWARDNTSGGRNTTTARLKIDEKATQDGMFIGMAISGGGSRAANFGAAVMLELAERQLLQKVDFISSVSGGSIAAAYYALDKFPGTRPPKIEFNRAQIDQVFARDFQARWIARWFDPRNIARYWTTAFDRSDIMVQVFEANLFHGATLGAMSERLPSKPSVLINASNFVTGRKFVFSNEAFDRRDSDLEAYPVARAVMASGAFPGAFANVTLQDYRSSREQARARYDHLFDGGPMDNLGVGTLIKVLQTHLEPYWAEAADPLAASGFPRGCLIIAIDAYTERVDPKPGEGKGRADLADTRPWYGFLVDTNAIEAMDALLAVKRNEVLHEMGLDRENEDVLGSFPLFRLNLDDDEMGVPRLRILDSIGTEVVQGPGLTDREAMRAAINRAAYCHVWHIGIAQLPRCPDCPLGRRVNKIGTWYQIDKANQCALFDAAKGLVQMMWEDPGLNVQGWLRDGFPTTGPIAPAQVAVGRKLQELKGKEPETGMRDGAEICQSTLNAGGNKNPEALPRTGRAQVD